MNKEMKAPQNKRSAVKPVEPALNFHLIKRGSVQPLKDGKQKWTLQDAIYFLKKKRVHIIQQGDNATIKVAFTHHSKGTDSFPAPAIVVDHASVEAGMGLSVWGCVDYLTNYHGFNLYNVTIKNSSAQ